MNEPNNNTHYNSEESTGYTFTPEGIAVPIQPAAPVTEVQAERFRGIMARVFVWMFSGLLVSGISGVLLAVTPIGTILWTNPVSIVVLVIAQLVTALVFSRMVAKVKPEVATVLFFLYSLLTGVTIAALLLTYELSSVISALFATAVVFGGMALWGAKTRRDLSAIGAAGRMLLLGAIVMSLVNLLLFFVAPGVFTVLDAVLNYVVLAIFIGLTAYDMQKIRRLAMEPGLVEAMDPAARADLIVDEQSAAALALRADRTIAIHGALMLYLDFINIFIRILRIFGRER
ncbi:MAG: Bax inhibitor-1/YccA family protein [Bacillota bacterium]|nr:Bax inhibitor-1/YccA family protein [Bacillota bacterium]